MRARDAASLGSLSGQKVKVIAGIPFSDDDAQLDDEAGVSVIQARARLMERVAASECARQGQLLAGIAGPDWHLAQEWCTETVVQIARCIYERREFSAMPILADALSDAGCGDELWLARMRDPNWPLCRGCHVLDSLLPELVHTRG